MWKSNLFGPFFETSFTTSDLSLYSGGTRSRDLKPPPSLGGSGLALPAPEVALPAWMVARSLRRAEQVGNTHCGLGHLEQDPVDKDDGTDTLKRGRIVELDGPVFPITFDELPT